MVDTVKLLEKINNQQLRIAQLEQESIVHLKALQDSKVRQTAFEKGVMMLPQLFYWVSPLGLIQACSYSFAAFFKVTNPQTLVGKNIFDVFADKDVDSACIDLIARNHVAALNQDKPSVFEESIRLAGAEVKNWLSYRQAVKNELNQPTGIVAVIFDITQRKNQDIERQEHRVQEAFDYVGSLDFLAKSKHDIKTPLMNLIGLAQIIQSQDPANEMMRDVLYSARQLERIVEEILDFTTKKCFDEPNQSDEFSVVQFIEEIKGTIRLMIEEKQIEFTTKLADDICRYIRTNRVRLQRIITNLLVNAIKHSRTEYLELEISLSKNFQGKGLMVRVKDHGVGIPKHHLSDVLYGKRIEKGRMTEESGQGLGLGIIYEYTRDLGGNVEVHSQVGVGTEFVIHVPYQPVVDVLEV
ncbi:MAG: PAS domain-containing sensor histidine kinase [Gammaproteobacteria bacterium]|nr:PAS domain-containing sensor histidine kinase [Gammaproteobacteria bacterium]